MDESAAKFFQMAIETPSPSGYEEPIQGLVREYISPFADEVRVDVHGNLIASTGVPEGPRLMYAGHCDIIILQEMINVSSKRYVSAPR